MGLLRPERCAGVGIEGGRRGSDVCVCGGGGGGWGANF